MPPPPICLLQVSTAEGAAKIKAHSAATSDGICKADCMNLAFLVAPGRVAYDSSTDVNTPPCVCGKDRIAKIRDSAALVYGTILMIVVGFILQYIGSS